jgi:hypothetical protein
MNKIAIRALLYKFAPNTFNFQNNISGLINLVLFESIKNKLLWEMIKKAK